MLAPSPSPTRCPAFPASPPQHFSTEDGSYDGTNGPFQCSPTHSLPAVQKNATVRARVAAGGWYNAAVKPLVPLLGEAHLRTW